MHAKRRHVYRPATTLDGVQMYKYGGAESGPEELRHFSLSGYRQGQPLPVPPEPTLFDTALKAMRRSPWTVRAMEVGAESITISFHVMLRGKTPGRAVQECSDSILVWLCRQRLGLSLLQWCSCL